MLHSAQLEYMREEKETIHSIHKAAMQNAPTRRNYVRHPPPLRIIQAS
jgi:hypothetical protein